ncbi:Swi SNF matrix associated, actin dependent regulator of chromatin, partial [Rhizophlyctis rosea]
MVEQRRDLYITIFQKAVKQRELTIFSIWITDRHPDDDKVWLFNAGSYDMLLSTLRKGNVTVNEIPAFVLSVLKKKGEGEEAKVERVLKDLEERLGGEEGMWGSLMEFQKVGVAKAVAREGRVLIGDEMGLGKTLQALAVCAWYRTEWPVLVICPSSLRLTWQAEIQKWLSVESDAIQVIFSGKDEVDQNAEFVIISYDLATKDQLAEQLSERKFKIVVADESHYLKSRDAKRTKTILPMLKNAKQALLLSGTPALSRPMELYTQLSALFKKFVSMQAFGTRYCDAKHGRYGWDYSGNSNTRELNWYLTKTVLIRRLKKDVLTELPEKRRQCIYVEIPAKAKKAMQKLKEKTNVLDAKIQRSKDNVEKFTEAQWEKRLHLVDMYGETGRAKIAPVVEYIGELYEDTGKKFIVFAHHMDVLDGISEYLDEKVKAKYIRIDGNTSQQIRHSLCEQFQGDAETRVAVLGITAAGVGLTLNAADLVIFAELFWNPAQLLQGEDRAHRIGREGNVDVKYILA